jgi:hypothetical protein
MLAVHLDNLLFLLLLGVAFLFQALARAVSKAKKDQTRPGSTPERRTSKPIPRARPESDEDRIRKFLEALGQPTTSRPPPPVMPRTDIPPRPLAPVQPPITPFAPVWKVSREERRKREVIVRESPPSQGARPAEKIIPPNLTGAPAFEVHEESLPIEPPPIIKAPAEAYAAATRPVAKGEESKTDIAILLASTSGLRNAIILREIFGRPRGMQRLDEMHDSLVPL